jgi:hypothetical protein
MMRNKNKKLTGERTAGEMMVNKFLMNWLSDGHGRCGGDGEIVLK